MHSLHRVHGEITFENVRLAPLAALTGLPRVAPIGASKSPSCPSLKPWAPLSKRTPCRKRGGFETEPVSCRCQKFSKISALVYFLYEVANIADFGKLVACIDAMVADYGMGGACLPPSRSQHASRNLPSPQCG